MIQDELHNRLLDMGFKVQAAPDEATIYTNSEGTVVTVHEPEQEEIKVAISKSNTHPVTGDVTPEQAAEDLSKILIARDTQ